MKYKVLDSIKNLDQNNLREQFALDVLTGFSSNPKYLSSKYFYDAKGSDLFKQITETEDYYPTRCEFEVFHTFKNQIIDALPDSFSLIELGAGDGRKTKVLLEEIVKAGKNITYYPIDISESAIKDLSESLEKEFPSLNVKGVVGEYIEGLNWINKDCTGPKVVLFLGSNLGNFNQTQSIVFLRVIWNSLVDGDKLLLGCDLKKDIDVMLSAYNDRDKITAAFNLNVLERINKELGGSFDLTQFQHFGTYNPTIGAMESYLISKSSQSIYIKQLQKEFKFRSFEPIHLEYSYKYSKEEIDYIAEETGYRVLRQYSDEKDYFSDFLLEVKKDA